MVTKIGLLCVSLILLLRSVPICAPPPEKPPVDFYGKYGSRYKLSPDEYRKHLVQSIHDASNDPDKLYDLLVLALMDRYFQEALDAVPLLEKLEGDTERATAVRTAALRNLGRDNEVVRYLETYLTTHKETASVLTNLGQAYYGTGETEKAKPPLIRALHIDPNFAAAFQMLSAIRYEQDGEKGRIAMEDEYSNDPRCFRAPLFKALRNLREHRPEDAKKLYADLVRRFPNEPAVLLGTTGDLGNAGYAADGIALVAPVYNPQKHGFSTGLNLLAGYAETKQPNEGNKLIRELRELRRYDIESVLNEYAKRFDAM